jgi:protein TonB
MTKAAGIAILLFALIAGFIIYAIEGLAPPPKTQVIQITQAQVVTIPAPKPPPPPPPKIIPPPKPLPVVIPKPPPIPSKIVVATKPPPPIHHIIRHIPKPVPHVEQHPPPPVTPPPATPTPPQAPVQSDTGAAEYGAHMHDLIQANQDVPQALAQLGVSGTALIQVEVAPSGQLISARVLRSSGVPLIDETALDHVRSATWPSFNADMTNTPHIFTIPVEIDGEDASQ